MRGLLRATAAVMVAAALQGCGFDLPGFPHIGPDIFVLDWTGGRNVLHADELPPIDLSEFAVRPAGTLADVEGFREMVRAQVEVILHAAEIDATVVTGERRWDANVVHIAPGAVDWDGDRIIGRGHYDPCNRSHRDSCIVYAQRMIDIGLVCSVREWVNIFANVAAHEIGHNLGFGHASAADLPAWTGYVELMLASHSWYDRRMEQRILVEQDTCPDASIAKGTPPSMPIEAKRYEAKMKLIDRGRTP